MKKFFSLFLLSMFVSVGYAEQISESQAAMIARKYLQGQTSSIKALKTANTTANNAEYYIFNNGNNNGFVIISGDDEMTELVGYSDSGSFVINENTPENIINWLDNYSDYVKAIRTDKASPIKQVVKGLGTPIVEPIVKTKWDQTTPYNDMCPYDSNQKVKCPTGCVATAMAQIMYFWQWPKVGTGFYSYESDYGVLSADFSQSVYDWGNMKTEYFRYRDHNGNIINDWTAEQAQAVAKLMSDCGIALNMGYTPTSSGTSDEYVNYSAANFFKYDSKIYGRDGMSDREFKAILRETLDKTIPVMYSGGGEGGGHEFVVDGYDSNNYLHVNWGWGGYSDGWFDMDYMNPSDLGTGGGTGGGFSKDQHMVIITPNKTNDAKYDQRHLYILNAPDFEGYVKAMSSSIQKGETLNVGVRGYWNGGGPTFSGMVGVAICNLEGDIIATMSQGQVLTLSPGMFIGSELLFPLKEELVNLPDGKYKIYAVTKEMRENYNFDWRRVISTLCQDIEVKGNTITTGQADMNFLETAAPTTLSPWENENTQIIPDSQFLVSVTLKNVSEVTAQGKFKVLIGNLGEAHGFASINMDCNLAPNQSQDFGFLLPMYASWFTEGKTYRIFIDPIFTPTNGNDFRISNKPQDECLFTMGGVSGVDENVTDNAIKVYPNPATDKVVVETDAEVISVSLYAIDGRLVQKVDNQKELNVSDCPAGHYIISVQTEEGITNQQIIKK